VIGLDLVCSVEISGGRVTWNKDIYLERLVTTCFERKRYGMKFSAAGRLPCVGINEGHERKGIPTQTLRAIAATPIGTALGHLDIVLAVARHILLRNNESARTDER